MAMAMAMATNGSAISTSTSTSTTTITTTTTTYPQVRLKQIEGSLVVTSELVTFQPSSSSSSSSSLSLSSSDHEGGNTNGHSLGIKWSQLEKHQVSPASHSKALLKLILKEGKNVTFRFSNRTDLERCRKDISGRLNAYRASSSPASSSASKKRSLLSSASSSSFGEMDPTALAVTRSTILAANQMLRSQHRYLVTETETLSEEDFWKTHQSLVEEEYAKIVGTTRAGTSSLMQSHLPLQGKVTLGVEEMRQIFILYPAVHKAYEEKVPLELSDEQFWRKYLESEFFHRDRGRIGTTARNLGIKEVKGASGKSKEEEDARAAAVGADDLFGRYDEKLRKAGVGANGGGGGPGGAGGVGGSAAGDSSHHHHHKRKKWGTQLAVGQFDLASTFETERGQLLEGPRDLTPPNTVDDGKGQKVISKYNRHWAMVLHPDEAVAGSDLLDVARRKSSQQQQQLLQQFQMQQGGGHRRNALDEDAKPHGGVDREMTRLVKYADAHDANQIQGMGIDDDDLAELNLANTENYFSSRQHQNNGGAGARARARASNESAEEAAKRRAVFGRAIAAKARAFGAAETAGDTSAAATATASTGGGTQVPKIPFFPPAQLGRELLDHLTKRMADDAKTEEDALKVVDSLDEDFKEKLHTYFRRSSELLRHFFGLRQLEGKNSQMGQQKSSSSQKLARIVQGLEAVYREMEAVRKGLPQNEDGEIMRKMCLPIMGQLDWAFQLHREESSGAGGSGGFVTVDEL